MAVPRPDQASEQSDGEAELQQSPSLIKVNPHHAKSWWATWMWEMFAMVASVVCMAAIVGILVAMEDQLSTDWPISVVSINTAISFFSTVANVVMAFTVSACIDQEKWRYFKKKSRKLSHLATFDNTSRGPIGAAQTLYSIHWGLAILGSIIILLSLITHTLVQQAVSTDPEYLSEDSNSTTFSFAHSYDTGAISTAGNNGYNELTADYLMQAAVFRGLNEDIWAQTSTCPSNCSWDQDLIVLGFDNACTNVTELTLATKKCTNLKDNPFVEPDDCIMITPGGNNLSTSFEQNLYASLTILTTKSLLFQDFGSGREISQTPEFLRIAFWTSAQANTSSTEDRNAVNPISGENVVECTLSLVGWKYSNISYTIDSLTVGSVKKVALPNTTASVVDALWAIDTPPGAQIGVATSSGRVGGYLNFTVADGSANTTLQANVADMMALVDFFASPSFSGKTMSGASENKPVHYAGVTMAFLNRNMTEVLDRVARSMTDQVQAGSTAQLAYGRASRSVIYIRVVWTWLAVPLALPVLAVVLLVATMWRNRRGGGSGVPLWKSSRTALLFYTLDEQGGLLECEFEDPEEAGSLEETLQARLN